MSIFSTSSIHIGKMKLFFKVLRRNYCDMALSYIMQVPQEVIFVDVSFSLGDAIIACQEYN